MDKEKRNKLLRGATALAAGVGTYALARAGFKKNPAQLASKGKLTWHQTSWEKTFSEPATLMQKGIKQLLYGDTKLISKTPRGKVEGAYYRDIDMTLRKNHVKADLPMNTQTDTIRNKIQDKLMFARMGGRTAYVPEAKMLHQVMGHPKNYKQFVSSFKNLDTESYVKPRFGYAGAGYAGEKHYGSKFIEHVKAHQETGKPFSKKLEKDLHGMYQARHNLIVGPEVKFEKIQHGPDVGKPVHEHRVHMIVHKGKVYPISSNRRWLDASSEYTPLITKPHLDTKIKGETMKIMQGLVGRNKNQLKGSYMLGVDAVRDIKGKVHVFEANDQSGWLDPTLSMNPLSAHKFYKGVTGRDTKVMAGAKGIAASALAGTALPKGKKRGER